MSQHSSWILEKNYSQKEGSGIGTGCPGERWGPSLEVFQNGGDVARGVMV